MERQEAEKILRSAPGYAAYMERREAEEKMPSSRPQSPQQVKTEPEAEPAAAKRRRSTPAPPPTGNTGIRRATQDPLVHQMEDQMDEALGFLGNLDRCGRIRVCCPLRHIMISNCVWTAAACWGGIQVTMMSRWLEK